MRSTEPAPRRSRTPANLSELRARLAGSSGRRYWRGLEELAETEEFLEYVHREFPEQADSFTDEASRRDFLKLMGASLALAGVSGCAFQPPEEIVPYVDAPEELVQGKPLFFATSLTLGGFATGLLVESHEGRPTKVEGNDLHPASLGASDAIAQASVLSLYDPDRSATVLRNGRISTWEAFQQALIDRVQKLDQGAGLRLLTGPISSPTIADQIERLRQVLPEMRWHQYEPVNRDNQRAGFLRAFNQDVQPRYHLDRANVVLSLGADFLQDGPDHLILSRDFADRRDPDHAEGMNRLYAVETNVSLTGANADHRLALKPSELRAFALEIARELGVTNLPERPSELPEAAGRWIAPLAKDLNAHAGRSVVFAGRNQPPVVHALAAAMNDILGNVGETIEYTEPVLFDPVDQTDSIRSLVEAMNAGDVDTLVMIGVNPVYDAPVDLGFRDVLLATDDDGAPRLPMRVHIGLEQDETAPYCQWHVPLAHDLESWGDGRAFNGTATLRQPLIEPLFGGRTFSDVLDTLLGPRGTLGRGRLRDYWRNHMPGLTEDASEEEFDRRWRKAVHDGLIADTAFEPIALEFQRGASIAKPEDFDLELELGSGLELTFEPDPLLYDGRFANNAWLQECPKPITKLTWDNALMIAASTAEQLGVTNGDIVALTVGTRTLDVPIWIVPGHASGAATLHIGYGRERVGRVGDGVGVNAYAIRNSGDPWFVPDVSILKTGRQMELASTQLHGTIEGRDLIRSATLDEYQEHPDFAHHGHHHGGGEHPTTIYQTEDHPNFGVPSGEGADGLPVFDNDWPAYAWGMSVDLNRCLGCSACVVACQAENNIPVVGKQEVIRGRAMHWMEVDRYFATDTPEGVEPDLDNPDVDFQPRFCMHCEQAPCEVVCPVAATVHDHEGLNTMVYNRCVGTRYCSNNCPYKVRHFNFLDYNEVRFKATSTSTETSPLTLLMNPDVTVRSRGVMEKCTYCVQRIMAGKIQSEIEGRRVRDGEIVTACQQACPAKALQFGDVNDPESQVSQNKRSPRNYGMLAEELNTRPRTTYLAKVRNPNPELETA